MRDAGETKTYDDIPTRFEVPADERRFEDYRAGDVFNFAAPLSVAREAVLAFAAEFGPERPSAAERSDGGLLASGWHVAAILNRLLVDHYAPSVASRGTTAGDELRWLHPVRSGDRLRLQTTVLSASRAAAAPDCGVVRVLCELTNQAERTVFTATVTWLVAERDGQGGPGGSGGSGGSGVGVSETLSGAGRT
jgi:acyl dehydratase